MFYVLEMVSWGLGRQTGSVILHINTSHDYSDKHMSCDYTNKCISCGGHDYLRELCARCMFVQQCTIVYRRYWYANGINENVLHFYVFRRVAVRADTCSIVAISINIQQKVHPVIWSQSNLPFDCSMALPLPKPIGELPWRVLVFFLQICMQAYALNCVLTCSHM